jgi:hypothetical protein
MFTFLPNMVLQIRHDHVVLGTSQHGLMYRRRIARRASICAGVTLAFRSEKLPIPE